MRYVTKSAASVLETKSIRFRARSFVAITLAPEAPLDAWLESLDRWIGNSPGYFSGYADHPTNGSELSSFGWAVVPDWMEGARHE